MPPDDLDTFIRDHRNLAHWHAAAARLRPGECYADVYADALIGLWDAARRWDPTRGEFSTFADKRIRGAITDGRRERDPLPRSVRRRGDVPNPTSLDAELDDRPALIDQLPAPGDPIGEWIDGDGLRSAIAQLNTQQQHVVTETLAGRTLAAIGVDMNVSEGRVCQIKAAAVHRLRRHLTAA